MMERDKLKELAQAATPGKWAWWTSNSYLRLSSARGGDGDVLHGAILRDGCCTITVSEANRDFIAAANPAAISELVALVEQQEAELVGLRSAARAAIAYDEAIQRCGNDPDSMSSFCTAEGDDLDSLYAAWISQSRAALENLDTPQAQPALTDAQIDALMVHGLPGTRPSEGFRKFARAAIAAAVGASERLCWYWMDRAEKAENSVRTSLPVKVESQDIEDPIVVPRGLLGAACYAISRKKDAPEVLKRLRSFTTGDRSTAPQPAVKAQCAAPDERAEWRAWYEDKYTSYIPMHDGEPVNLDTLLSWKTWQAARASIAAQPAKAEAPRCKDCNDTGMQHAGYSGLESDGNAPLSEPCDSCGYGDATPAPAMGEELPVLPKNVYFRTGNFYDATTCRGMGQEFYAQWQHLAAQFPSSACMALRQPAVSSAEAYNDALETAAEIADGWDTGNPDGCAIAEEIRSRKSVSQPAPVAAPTVAITDESALNGIKWYAPPSEEIRNGVNLYAGAAPEGQP